MDTTWANRIGSPTTHSGFGGLRDHQLVLAVDDERMADLDGGHDHGPQVDLLLAETDLAGADSGQVEEIFDQPNHERSLALERTHGRLLHLRSGLRGTQDVSHLGKNSERRAQLVSDRRQKVILLAVGLFQLPRSLAQLVLELPARGHVADCAGHEDAGVGRQGAEQHADWKLMTVFPQADQIAFAAHGPRLWVGGIGVALNDVRAMKPLGHEHLNRAADQLVPAEAEQILGLAVHLNDGAISIDDHDCVGGGFEKSVEEAFSQPGERSFPIESTDRNSGNGRIHDVGHGGAPLLKKAMSTPRRMRLIQLRAVRRPLESPPAFQTRYRHDHWQVGVCERERCTKESSMEAAKR